MTWSLNSEPLRAGRGRRCWVSDANGQLSFAGVVDLWQHEPAFADFFGEALAKSEYDFFRWELPPVARRTFDQLFEFVMLDDPVLGGRDPEPEAFAKHFSKRTPGQTVVAFPNLGGDAVLVVPCPVPGLVYPELATFLRTAPPAQRRELWPSVGAAVAARVSDREMWLSTAGGGVAWLHVRLDSSPKYYHHQPYRRGR